MRAQQAWPHRWFGFWDTVPYGSTPYPRIEEFFVTEDDRPKDREAISRYFRSGCPLISENRQFIADPVTGLVGRGIVSVRTDGIWVWRDDLADYILRYPLMIPDAFTDHIRSRDCLPLQPGDAIDESQLDWPPSAEPGSASLWIAKVDPAPSTTESWDRRWYGYWALPGSEHVGWPKIDGFLTRTRDWADLDRVCEYLMNSKWLHGPLRNRYTDPVSGEIAAGDLGTYSDGEWVWHGTLPALLRKYPLDLPPSMLRHIRELNYVTPSVPEDAFRWLDYPPGEIPDDTSFVKELMDWTIARSKQPDFERGS